MAYFKRETGVRTYSKCEFCNFAYTIGLYVYL